VNRQTEFYPRGGIKQLVRMVYRSVFALTNVLLSQKRGLRQLKAAGIQAILDHHAPPGAQAVNQQFAGQ
jgi:glucan endo-1,6-beta-glucosidase